MNKNKNIAVAISLVVVLGAFSTTLFPALASPQVSSSLSDKLGLSALTLAFPTLETPDPEKQAVADAAWKTFTAYREFARVHNLAGVSSLSYQLSAACTDPAQVDECNDLMDSVYVFTQGFRQRDFKNVFFDERQIVMYTEYIQDTREGDPTQRVLLFTRDVGGHPQILGIKVCSGNKDIPTALGLNCIETDPARRDMDGNGWWDEIETKFYK